MQRVPIDTLWLSALLLRSCGSENSIYQADAALLFHSGFESGNVLGVAQ